MAGCRYALVTAPVDVLNVVLRDPPKAGLSAPYSRFRLLLAAPTGRVLLSSWVAARDIAPLAVVYLAGKLFVYVAMMIMPFVVDIDWPQPGCCCPLLPFVLECSVRRRPGIRHHRT